MSRVICDSISIMTGSSIIISKMTTSSSIFLVETTPIKHPICHVALCLTSPFLNCNQLLLKIEKADLRFNEQLSWWAKCEMLGLTSSDGQTIIMGKCFSLYGVPTRQHSHTQKNVQLWKIMIQRSQKILQKAFKIHFSWILDWMIIWKATPFVMELQTAWTTTSLEFYQQIEKQDWKSNT